MKKDLAKTICICKGCKELLEFEYGPSDYMMWFSEESIYRYHKVYNVFELEGQNGHKVV